MSRAPGAEEPRAVTPAEKRELLARLLKQKLERGPTLPLSHGQQALWLLHRLAPESPAYNVAFGARVRSELDTEALQRAFARLTERHEMLRAVFEVRDGQPRYRIQPSLDVVVDEHEVTAVSPSELDALLLQSVRRPFDLERGPPFRVSIFHLGGEEHVLLLVIHHIVVDGQSLAILVDEWSELYAAERAGSGAGLEPLPARYRDFVRWQTDLVAGPSGEEMGRFWESRLEGLPAVLELPADRARPRKQSFRGASRPFELDEETTASLRSLASARGTTLYVALLSAFWVLLHRYTGKDDIAVGSPTGGRSHRDFQGLVGYFVNPVVLRGSLEGDPPFVELLERARRVVLDALKHGDFPFPSVVQRLNPVRDASHSPLFQVDFSLIKAERRGQAVGKGASGAATGGLVAEPLPLAQQEGQFDLSLEVLDYGSTLVLNLKYATDLLDEATVARMTGHLQVLLRGILEAPEARLSELPILTAAEIEEQARFNRTPAEIPERCVHDLVLDQSTRTPHRPALVAGGTSLSYRELDERADAVARALRERGVMPGVRVGVFLERGPDMVTGVLGILKAGGAYVPLDPAFPAERLSYMVEDSQAAVVLAHGALMDAVPTRSVPVLLVDQVEDGGGAAVQRPSASLDDTAYVIYTSGSTGRPKGVAVSHRNLVNFLSSMARQPGLNENDVLLSVTTLSFDIAALELFLPLLKGGRVCLASREETLDGERLQEKLASAGATVMQATPATWRLLIESGWEGSPGLKALCGGEALPPELARDLVSRTAALWNMYGPTETTVWSSVWRVEPAEGPISIGHPIQNTQMHVLNAALGAQPVGVPGELYIGGAGVAQGYWGRPELTAERFVPDPFSTEPGARLYRTGDLARRLPDGRLECLGRVDHQVKVRGFRIELGEIETTLERHPSVKQAVVEARDDPGGDRRLIGYLVGEDGVSVEDLRHHLGEHLPEYMIPARFVSLDSFPLTPNGKVDRGSLPAPEDSSPVGEACVVAPRTPTEEILAGIWAEVLGVAPVSVEADFFALGGHSLQAAQALSRLRKALDVDLPLREFFAAPTVASLAARIEAPGEDEREPLRREGLAVRGPLSSIQRRLWFFHRLEPDSATYNMSLRFEMMGALDVGVLQESVTALVDRHEALRTRFEEEGGEPFATVVESTPLALPVEDLKGRGAGAEAELDRLLNEDGRQPFDLQRPPLLRARLVQMDDARSVLGLTLHHIASDGWSMGVLARELLETYESISQGQEPGLGPLAFRYRDHVAAERRWLGGPAADRQLEYWRGRLSGSLPVVDLPRDYSRPEVQTFNGGTLAHRLPEGLTRRVAALSRAHGVTPFMSLLSAFALLLHRLTGLEDLPIGVPVAGRGRQETDGIVGVFINTVVTRHDLSAAPAFAELLARTRRLAVEAYRNAEVPFDRVVEALQPRRDPSRPPLFQVLFNSIDLGGHRRVELPALTVDVSGAESGDSKFDLTLYVGPSAEGTDLILSFNRDLYRPERMESLLAQYEFVLGQAVSHPERPVSQISLLAESARAVLPDPTRPLEPWTGPTLTEPFLRHARRTPDRRAVVDVDGALDYGAMEQLSAGLAGRLGAAGVSRGDVVALFCPRSRELVWGMLGVLRAGAGFVVLDPDHPPARVLECLRVSKASAWLASPRLGAPDPALGEALEEREWALRAELGPALLEGGAPRPDDGATNSDDMAYVAFTSGTRGGVKGILGTHGPPAHFLSWQTRTFGLNADDRFSLLSGLSHDPLLRDVFAPLHAGATLCVPDPDVVLMPSELRRWLADEAVTVVHVTPSLAAVLAEGAEAGVLPSLRYAFLGGEVLTQGVVDALRRLAPSVSVVNFYGATETPQAVGWHGVSSEADEGEGSSSIPIGRGIDDVQLLVLGQEGGLAGIGELGEIGVRTPHLARGYVDDEPLTRERFICSPFSEDPGDRIYRTGDLGRYGTDGLVEYAGRRDEQVKVRGYRVEPGAIDQLLHEHPGVRQACVLAVAGDGPAGAGGEVRLVAYLVLDPAEPPTVTDLRRHLRAHVPDYMVPSLFVTLDAFPLTPNGKVDRSRLETSSVSSLRSEEVRQPPRTEAERFVAEVWRETLEIESVDVGDNFFDLGGHSLQAIRVLARIEERTGQRINPRLMIYQPLERFAAGLDIGPLADSSGARGGRGALRRLWAVISGLRPRAQPESS